MCTIYKLSHTMQDKVITITTLNIFEITENIGEKCI